MVVAGLAKATDTCPTWPTLLASIESDLPAEKTQLLNTHMPDCDECRAIHPVDCFKRFRLV